MEVEDGVAQGQDCFVDVMGNNFGNGAVGPAGEDAVHILAVDGGEAPTGKDGRQVEGGEDDHPAVYLCGSQPLQ